MGRLIPTVGKTTSTGGFSNGYRFANSFFTSPGGKLIKGSDSGPFLQGAVAELSSDVENNYAALSDASTLLSTQDKVLTQAGSQPIYGPDPGSNWLIWGLLAGLVVLYFVFSK